MSTVIFNEVDRHQTARYKVKGCEKAIIVRSSVEGFILNINTVSLSDPHFRTFQLMNIANSGDYPILGMPIDCGMELIFQLEEPVDPLMHLFVEIIDETCNPEKCCPCE